VGAVEEREEFKDYLFRVWRHSAVFGTTILLVSLPSHCPLTLPLFTMKATLKGKYDVDKNGAVFATVAVNAADVKLRASVTEATFINGPSLTGLALAVEKPGVFIVDYNVPKKVQFQILATYTTSIIAVSDTVSCRTFGSSS